MATITPVSGWALDAIVALDEACPGFAGRFLRASNERRQVIAAFLSNISADHDAEGATGEYLGRANHRSILAQAFEHVPDGFRRALAKSGAHPHDAAYYRDLYDALAFGHLHVVTAIMHVTWLNPERLEIINMLPADLCDCRIIERIKDLQHARDLIAVIDLFEERTGRREGLVKALMASPAPIESIVRRWCRQIKYAEFPIEESASYRPIRDGLALHEVARRYRNCGRNYTATALLGESAFGEFIAEDGRRVLLCFDKSEGDWALDGVYARRNRPVPDSLGAQAREFVYIHDIRDRWDSSQTGNDVARALGRLLQPYSEW
ncbi:hypothetical protein WBP06_00460 [Novosphingobium sp. BL-8H]|uniref:hypothetical protein n=1 Tax=Novosphingobium sp. BL-8H TaxID=3127640 RepID=UPI0037578696